MKFPSYTIASYYRELLLEVALFGITACGKKGPLEGTDASTDTTYEFKGDTVKVTRNGSKGSLTYEIRRRRQEGDVYRRELQIRRSHQRRRIRDDGQRQTRQEVAALLYSRRKLSGFLLLAGSLPGERMSRQSRGII